VTVFNEHSLRFAAKNDYRSGDIRQWGWYLERSSFLASITILDPWNLCMYLLFTSHKVIIYIINSLVAFVH